MVWGLRVFWGLGFGKLSEFESLGFWAVQAFVAAL